MFSRLRKYFASFDKGDWEMIGYLAIIVAMVLLIPVVWFWDYLHTPQFNWWLLRQRFFLTESLQNWWAWVLDKLRGLW